MRAPSISGTIAAFCFLASVSAADPGQERNPPASAAVSPATLPMERGPKPASGPNLVLNGDFENTSATSCLFNVTNVTFNSLVPNVYAFGGYPQPSAGEIDLMVDAAGCGFIAPWSGRVKLGFSNTGTVDFSDAMALGLSSPVAAAGTYRVSFHGWAYATGFAPDTGAVEIGLSSDPHSFGTLVFQATPVAGDWQEFTHVFVAPVSATYLTVRQSNSGDTWNHLDGFSLTVEAPVPTDHVSWGTIKTRFR